MPENKVSAIVIKSFALLIVLGIALQAMAQEATKMAPIDQYLMTDRDAEITLAQSAAPRFHRLRRDGEHEIDVHIVEASGAQSVEALENLFARVNAAEPFQQMFIKRLHAHGNAIDAEVAPEFRFVE